MSSCDKFRSTVNFVIDLQEKSRMRKDVSSIVVGHYKLGEKAWTEVSLGTSSEFILEVISL